MVEHYKVKFWVICKSKRALGEIGIASSMPFSKIAPKMPSIIADKIKNDFSDEDITEKNIVIVELHNLSAENEIQLEVVNGQNLATFCKIVKDLRNFEREEVFKNDCRKYYKRYF